MSLADWIPLLKAGFPKVSMENCRLTSPEDPTYNCIAWAAGDAGRWWWPDSVNQTFWPVGVPHEVNLSAFECAFGLEGYAEHSTPLVEVGVHKVAIYAQNGLPTHASRQLADGWWASKLGKSIDVEHTLDALDGPVYGAPVLVLGRRAAR